jgi:hypothetical protein
MYLNRWVLLVSLVIGIPGVVFTARAFTQYTDAARVFSDVSTAYVPGSFTWLEPDYSSGALHLTFRNDSDTGVTVSDATRRSCRNKWTRAASIQRRVRGRLADGAGSTHSPRQVGVLTQSSLNSSGATMAYSWIPLLRILSW